MPDSAETRQPEPRPLEDDRKPWSRPVLSELDYTMTANGLGSNPSGDLGTYTS